MYSKIVRTTVYAIIFLLSTTVASGQCPDMEKVSDFFRENDFITLDFIQMTHSDIFESVDTLKGSLWADYRGRFRLDMDRQVLVSDSILYWSYSADNRQVLIDSVSRLGDWNPLMLLYDPNQVYICLRQEKAEDTLKFEMRATDSTIYPQQFNMQIDANDLRPIRLIYYDENESLIEINVDNFLRPSNLSDSLFIFSPDPDIEVIEMP